MASLSDFSGVLKLVAATAGATVGTPVQIQSVWYLPVASSTVGDSSIAASEEFSAHALWAHAGKVLVGATKTAGVAWTAGMKIYVDSSGNFNTVSTGNTLAGVAHADATSAATTGDVVLGAPI